MWQRIQTLYLLLATGLVAALFWFKKRFILTDEKVAELSEQVKALHEAE